MVIAAEQLGQWVGSFMWPLMRVSAMFMAMPVFGARLVPVRIRAALSLLVTLVIYPVLPEIPTVEPLSADALLIAIQQIAIGVLMGFILQLVFAAVAFGGQGIALSMGLGFASMVDPQSGVQVPVVGQFFIILATLLFLLFDAHLVLIAMLADSFHTMPVATTGLVQNTVWDLVTWAGRTFAGGVLIALPAIAALLLVNLSFGIVTRAAPQLNIFAVGFPVAMLLGFVLIWVSLSNLPPLFKGMLDGANELIRASVTT